MLLIILHLILLSAVSAALPHLQACFVTLQPLNSFHVLSGESVHYSLVLLGVFLQLR